MTDLPDDLPASFIICNIRQTPRLSLEQALAFVADLPAGESYGIFQLVKVIGPHAKAAGEDAAALIGRARLAARGVK